MALQGAFVKKFRDNWYFSLNGEKQLFVIPTLFDSCIIDAENLCSFGFTIILWIKFNYNFKQYPIENTFEQILFFVGKSDFSTGLETFLNVYPTPSNPNNNNQNMEKLNPTYTYVVTINYKTPKYTITKNFKISLDNIERLNELNCLSIQFSPKFLAQQITANQSFNLNLNWLNTPVEDAENYYSAKKTINTYSSYLSSNLLRDYGLKSSTFSGTNSIGIIGDLTKQSYFNIENIQLKNCELNLADIEYDFSSFNPTVFEFDSYERLMKTPNLNVIGSPQIIDSRYGKSLVLSTSEQKLIFRNVSNSCFGNLNYCKNGYTIKIWFCLTNYNNMYKQQQQPGAANNNASTFGEARSTQQQQQQQQARFTRANRKIFIVANGAKTIKSYKFNIFYDLNKSSLVVNLKTVKKAYKSEINLKLKLYIWYILTVTWDELDGLRVYVNNRLLDHTIGVKNQLTNNADVYGDLYNYDDIEFTLGQPDYLDAYQNEIVDGDESSYGANKNNAPINNINLLDQFYNQTEDAENFSAKNVNAKNGNDFGTTGAAGTNGPNNNNNNLLVNANFYELIVHKIVHYNVRKYPDEIISRNVIIKGNIFCLS